MNEEKPKSIWKKPLKLPGLFMLWLILMLATILIFSIIIWLNNDTFNKPSDFIGLLIFGAVVASILLCFWLFIRWVFHWRNFKRFLFGLACFITLIALFYAEEDWRGKHDWNKFKREQEAKGERFDWQSIVPPPVPDDENFAFSPVWIAEIRQNFWGTSEKSKSWYGDRIYSEVVSNFLPLLPVSTSTVVGTNMWRFPQPPDNSDTWVADKFIDLKPFQSFYRNVGETNPAAQIIIAPQPQTPAQDVLLALSKFNPVIEQLRRDSAKPYSRFPIQYDDEDKAMILLPHLAAEKRFAMVLQLRVVAELQNGETEKAFDDLKLMFRLMDASRNEPFLISHLVRIAILNLALQPIWEGLAEHKWSDAQLDVLENELAKLNFLMDYESSMRAERVGDISLIEFYQKNRNFHKLDAFLSMLGNFDGSGQRKTGLGIFICYYFAPGGWFEQNKLRMSQFLTQNYFPIANTNLQILSPTAANVAKEAGQQEIKKNRPDNFFANLLIPELAHWSWTDRIAYGQNNANLARVAIALERYRLANGNYPESLDALAPKFISEMPHDVINGEPLKYRREANDKFVLYSVGWNERDDGGVVVFQKGTSPGVDISEGDWVWKYPSGN